MRPFPPEGSAKPAVGDLPPGCKYAFDPFLLDPHARTLLRNGTPVELTRTQFELLRVLAASNGGFVTKDALMQAVWNQLVDESSVHKLISDARRVLDPDERRDFILNRRRLGYRLGPSVRIVEPDAPDVDIDALIAPHRKWIDGRAAMETLTLDGIVSAQTTFEALVAAHPHTALFYVGLANACALQAEASRTDAQRDVEAREQAVKSAHRAVELSPDLAEAFATLGFVLGLAGERVASLSAFQRALMLEPDNWLICARHGVVSWGEERYRAARRAVALFPQFVLGYWLVASVYVARGQFLEAEREIDRAERIVANDAGDTPRFLVVAIHYLKGLLCLARGDYEAALAAFHRELELEGRGHFYARECCANTWYAIGAFRMILQQPDAARAAFLEALERVPRHPQAIVGLMILDGQFPGIATRPEAQGEAASSVGARIPFEVEMARAALMKASGNESAAVEYLRDALRHAPPGSAGWFIALDPLLRVWENRTLWEPVTDKVGTRAS